MHLLIVGGATGPLGGLEAFRDRSAEALEERRPNWRINRLPGNTAYLSIRKLPRMIGGLLTLLKYGLSRPDYVWLHYVNLPDLAYLGLARLLGLRVMVTPHLGLNWRSQQRPSLRSFSQWLLHFASRMALLSPTQEKELALPPNVPKLFIRNFLPLSVLADLPPLVKSGPLRLIHSCRLSEGKGTFLFIEVCIRLVEAGIPFHARITGKAVDQETDVRLAKLIETYQLGTHVEVLGRVSDEKLVELLRQSDVLVHLSKIDSYPLIVLEAFSCEAMPLCLSLAGAVDMVNTYGGHLVGAENTVDETVEYLSMHNPEQIRAIGQIGSVKVRSDYAWDRVTDRLEEAFQAMAK